MTTTLPADYVSNSTRKIRASVDRTPASLRKGNSNSQTTNGKLHRDTKPSFPQIAFGNELPYEVDPYEVVNGVFFDLPKRRQMGIIPGAEKTAKRAATGQKTTKSRTRRKAPAPGTRPSLSAIRSKG